MNQAGDEADLTWSRAMGITIVRATAGEVIAELEIGPEHKQAFGLVHGGVYCGVIESAVSMGASIVAKARGQAPPVGLENHTSFVRAASGGRLRVTATPLTSGRTTQLWEATIVDEEDRVIAVGRVRMLCREAKHAP